MGEDVRKWFNWSGEKGSWKIWDKKLLNRAKGLEIWMMEDELGEAFILIQ